MHIDLLPTVDTDSFLMALLQLIADHEKPWESLPEQGTNFVCWRGWGGGGGLRGGVPFGVGGWGRWCAEGISRDIVALHSPLLSKKNIILSSVPLPHHTLQECGRDKYIATKSSHQVVLGLQAITEVMSFADGLIERRTQF